MDAIAELGQKLIKAVDDTRTFVEQLKPLVDCSYDFKENVHHEGMGERLVESFNTIHFDASKGPTSLEQFPGYVVVPIEHQKRIKSMVDSVNESKRHFGDSFTEINQSGDFKEKAGSALFRYFQDHGPASHPNLRKRVNPRYIQRQILAYSHVFRISFYAEQQRRVEKVNVEKLLDEHKDCAAIIDPYLVHADRLRRIILSNRVRYRVNMNSTNGKLNTSVSLPIVLFGNKPRMKVKVSQAVFERHSKQSYTCLLSKLNIYLVDDKHAI